MLQCLIIEDNPLNWMIMQNQAIKLGMNVNVCTNGLEALEYCQQNTLPELIFLDGYMPEMDGVSFLKLLRKLPDGQHPYVVFCSSSLELDDVSKALDEGAECHFPKPITVDQINYAIRQVKSRREKRGIKEVKPAEAVVPAPVISETANGSVRR